MTENLDTGLVSGWGWFGQSKKWIEICPYVPGPVLSSRDTGVSKASSAPSQAAMWHRDSCPSHVCSDGVLGNRWMIIAVLVH